MTEVWKRLEGQVVNGEFPLRQYLGSSDHSVVFLTEHREQGLQDAAIKLIPANPQDAELQHARWELATKLFHPHLIRLFQMGRCQLSDVDLLFVVMEYAEEDLSQVLPDRPLTSHEAREMLLPALDALAFIHGQGLVHGHIRPSNIMAVNDQVKVSSDSLCRTRDLGGDQEGPGVYDPPEFASGVISPAGDVWSLGMVLVEVLTQHPPNWVQTEQVSPAVPETVPMPFRELAHRCLQRDPLRRWTVAEIAARLQENSLSLRGKAMVKQVLSRRRYFVPVGALGVVLIGVLAVPWLFNRQTRTQLSNTIEQPRVQEESGEELGRPPQPQEEPGLLAGTPNPGEVIDEVLPDVPQSASNTIQGTVRVSVRVYVDQTGNVTEAEIDSPGPSRYFAGLALQASRLWKFTPPKIDGRNVSSEWILRFGFTRSETQVDPVQRAP